MDLDFTAEFSDPKLISVRIYEQIRNAIILRKLPEGQRIVEADLTRAFRVSRSPIRDALKLLAAEGFVDLIPYRGATVSGISPENVREHYEIKGMVEGFAAHVGAQRFTEKDLAPLETILREMEKHVARSNLGKVLEANFVFHKRIVDGVRNARLSKFYDSLTHSIRRFGTIGLTEPRFRKLSLQEHREILDAIRARKPSLAEERTRTHALNMSERVLDYMKRSGHGDSGRNLSRRRVIPTVS
jgi:DNA-binding GntR family transcriptional regulator